MARKKQAVTPEYQKTLMHILSPEYRDARQKEAEAHEATLRQQAEHDPGLLSDIEMHLNDSHNCGTCYDLWQRHNGIKKGR